MKQGYRFVDCDMHIMEPPDLFDKYLDPAFKHRITSSMRRSDGGPTGMRGRPLWFFDGTPTSNDGNISQYNRTRGPLVSRRANTNVMFAVERGYDAEAQVMGMEMEGIDIAVLFPTAGLSFIARDNMDPQFSAAIGPTQRQGPCRRHDRLARKSSIRVRLAGCQDAPRA